jgi:hypothetical protein
MSRLTPLEQSTHPMREIEPIHLHESIHHRSKTIQIKKHERLMTSCARAAGQKQVGTYFFNLATESNSCNSFVYLCIEPAPLRNQLIQNWSGRPFSSRHQLTTKDALSTIPWRLEAGPLEVDVRKSGPHPRSTTPSACGWARSHVRSSRRPQATGRGRAIPNH